jgi:hypothetical protein
VAEPAREGDQGQHPCPGRCGLRIRHDLYACSTCWYRLPKPLRDAVWHGYRTGAGHREAMAAANDWYRDNPKESARA